MTEAEKIAQDIIFNHEKDFGKVRTSTAILFQDSAQHWYHSAHACEHTGSGPRFRADFLKRAELNSAVARLILTRD